MSRRVHTADDVLDVARKGGTELVVAPADLVTPLAHDLAAERGVRITTRDPGHERDEPARPGRQALLHHVAGVNVMTLDPFPADLHRPEMDVRLLDVVTAEHGLPMAAGVLSLRAGSFPWTLDYDEVEYVIEGELHITTSSQKVVGRPGDGYAVPKGCALPVGAPTGAKFLYVTYPADWNG